MELTTMANTINVMTKLFKFLSKNNNKTYVKVSSLAGIKFGLLIKEFCTLSTRLVNLG